MTKTPKPRVYGIEKKEKIREKGRRGEEKAENSVV
jgi:hypothetical protein